MRVENSIINNNSNSSNNRVRNLKAKVEEVLKQKIILFSVVILSSN